MKWPSVFLASVLCGWLTLGSLPAIAQSATPDVQRQGELMHLLRQDCGACHGMTMRGGLGQPLTPEALHDKPLDGLVATILQGRPGTAMPPWKPFMNADEAAWLVRQLQAGLPASGDNTP